MLKYATIIVIYSCLHISLYSQQDSKPVSPNYTSAITGNNLHGLRFSRNAQLMESQADQTQRLDSIIEFNYNEESDEWNKRHTKTSYTYNINNAISHYHLYSWDSGSNTWIDLLKEEYSYDSQGRMSSYVSSVYIGDKQWNKEDREDYTYNPKNELSTTTSYKWKHTLNDWQIATNWKYSYNEDGTPLKDSAYWWNKQTQDWMLHNKVDYTYINNKPHYIYKSTLSDNTWLPSEKKWYLYGNINWELYTLSTYKWISTSDDWKIVSREGFGYNDQFELTKHSYANRQLDSEEWTTFLAEEFSYDYDFGFNELSLPFQPWEIDDYSPFYFHHKITGKTLKKRNAIAEKETPYREVLYYYSSNVSTNSLATSDVSSTRIFPNPTTDYVIITIPTGTPQIYFELFNLAGIKELSTLASPNTKINLENLKSGIYIYRLTADNQLKTGKFVIK